MRARGGLSLDGSWWSASWTSSPQLRYWLAVITFSTPDPECAKPLSARFDEMVSTFRMFGGDDDVTDPLS